MELIETPAFVGGEAKVATLQAKMDDLTSAIENEEVSIGQYIANLQTAVKQDVGLAIALKNAERLQEAAAVFKRVKIMRDTLAAAEGGE